jgi:mannose-6-phosphate isomerase-like protein (cupin superfamily)
MSPLEEQLSTINLFYEEMEMKLSYLVSASVAVAAVSYGVLLMAHGADVPEAGKPMQYFKQASKMELKSMGVKDTHAYLSDVVGSHDAKAPISCGFFKIDKGNSLTYTYDYDEAKIITAGEMNVNDGTQTVKAVPGDILFFPVGSTITFSSDTSGTGFICGQREFDGA